MIDRKLLRENPELVRQSIANKGFDPIILDRVLPLDSEVRELEAELQDLRTARNLAAQNGPDGAEEGKLIKQKLGVLEERFNAATTELEILMKQIPNLALASVPVGASEADNIVIRQVGQKPEFDFQPKPHWELGVALNIIDNERAAKVSGARFTYLKGRLALLQFALIQYVFSIVTNEQKLQEIITSANLNVPATPFIPVVPPVFIKPEMYDKMARLEPKDERYYMPADDLFLIGSAEHTLGAMHADEVLPEESLPLRYIGYSTAFRREAGSYGKDTKGILRLHQFDKLELESFSTKEQSVAEQDFFVAIEEYIVNSLGLPYQVLEKCTADIGDPDARGFDIETWMPGQGVYRETHTADLMTDYQARRLKTRVKRTSGENEFVHMNDATATAIGRTLIAIMENYQQSDGSINVPEALVPFCGFSVISGGE